jgi:hypothetical protein
MSKAGFVLPLVAVAALAAAAPAAAAQTSGSLIGGSVVSATTYKGHSYAFVRGTDSKIYFRDIETGVWSRINLASTVASGPSVAVVGESLMVSVTMSNGDMAIATTSSANPGAVTGENGDWKRYNAGFTSAPAMVHDPVSQGTAYVGRGANGSIRINDASGNGTLPGATTSPPAVSYNEATRTTIVTVRGTDGRLYRAEGHPAGNLGKRSFTPFRKVLDQQVGSAASVASTGNRSYFRSTYDRLDYLDGARSTTFGGGVVGTPFAVSQHVSGNPEAAFVLFKGSDRQLWAYDTVAKQFRALGGIIN